LRNITLVLTLSAITSLLAQSFSSYHVTHTYTLGGDGSWDYIVPDPPNHGLFIARQNRVMVVDEDSGTLLGEVTGIQGAHGTARGRRRYSRGVAIVCGGAQPLAARWPVSRNGEPPAGYAAGAGHRPHVWIVWIRIVEFNSRDVDHRGRLLVSRRYPVRSRRSPVKRAGIFAFWAGVALLTLSWYRNITVGIPPDPFRAGISGLIFFSLTLAWAYWINRLRPISLCDKLRE